MFKKVVYLVCLLNTITVVSFQQKSTALDSIYWQVEKLYKKKSFNAIHLITESLNLKPLSNLEDSIYASKIGYIKGLAYYDSGAYTKAKAWFNKALRYTPKNEKGSNLKGTILFDRAFAEYYLEQYIESYNSTKQAEAVLSRLKKPDYNYLLSIYADLSGSAVEYGFYNEAELYLKKGVQLYKEHKNSLTKDVEKSSKPILFEYYYVNLYAKKGDEKKLLYHIKKLQTLYRLQKFNEEDRLRFAVALNYTGDFYLNFKEKLDIDKALAQGKKYIEKALKILDKKKYVDHQIQFTFNLAKYYRYSKQYDAALRINSEIFELANKNDARLPFFYAQKGLIYSEKGEKSLAIKALYNMVSLIHKGKAKLKKDGSNFVPSTELHHTGLLVEVPEILIKQHPNSLVILKQAAVFFEMGMQQFKNCYRQETFSKKLKNYYTLALKGIIKTNQLGLGSQTNHDILNNIENIENRLAWKEFNQNRKLTKASIPDSIFKKEITIRKKIVAARKNKDSLLVTELQNQLEKQNSFLTEQFPKVFEYAYSSFNIKKFQKELDNNAIVVRYKKIDNELYVFKISKNHIVRKVIDFSLVEPQVKRYISILKERKADKKLAEKLFKKLFPFVVAEKEIIIIPDAVLHHLPFETLVNLEGNYLIVAKSVSYASDMVFIKQKRKKTKETIKEMYLFSPSYQSNKKNNATQLELRGAANETKIIANIFTNKLFSKEKATKENFIKQASKAKIIHLAMHANIDNIQPELSYFTFASTAQKNQQKLYLEELYALKLNAHLAVLSACNTATGYLENYNGAISLQRAFTLAGVSSTVSSLWDVPDKATQEIIVDFYKNLKKGFSKSKALQEAKISYLNLQNDMNLNVPYYWAGFVISGDITPIIFEEKSTSLLFYLGLTFLFCVVLFWLFQQFQKR